MCCLFVNFMVWSTMPKENEKPFVVVNSFNVFCFAFETLIKGVDNSHEESNDFSPTFTHCEPLQVTNHRIQPRISQMQILGGLANYFCGNEGFWASHDFNFKSINSDKYGCNWQSVRFNYRLNRWLDIVTNIDYMNIDIEIYIYAIQPIFNLRKNLMPFPSTPVACGAARGEIACAWLQRRAQSGLSTTNGRGI